MEGGPPVGPSEPNSSVTCVPTVHDDRTGLWQENRGIASVVPLDKIGRFTVWVPDPKYPAGTIMLAHSTPIDHKTVPGSRAHSN
jgi:hypothetical protein